MCVSVPIFSFSVLGIFASPKDCQWCFNKVSRVFEVKTCFKGRMKYVSRVFTESFKGVSNSLKDISRMFQGNFKGVSRKLQRCFK